MIFEAVATRMEVGVELKAYARGQFLGPTDFVIILGVGPNVADALAGGGSGVSDKAGEQRILDRWRGEEPVVSGVDDGFCLVDVVREADAGTGLLVGADQIEMIVAKASVNRKVSQRREMIL